MKYEPTKEEMAIEIEIWKDRCERLEDEVEQLKAIIDDTRGR